MHEIHQLSDLKVPKKLVSINQFYGQASCGRGAHGFEAARLESRGGNEYAFGVTTKQHSAKEFSY